MHSCVVKVPRGELQGLRVGGTTAGGAKGGDGGGARAGGRRRWRWRWLTAERTRRRRNSKKGNLSATRGTPGRRSCRNPLGQSPSKRRTKRVPARRAAREANYERAISSRDRPYSPRNPRVGSPRDGREINNRAYITVGGYRKRAA